MATAVVDTGRRLRLCAVVLALMAADDGLVDVGALGAGRWRDGVLDVGRATPRWSSCRMAASW
jgi:hypothetical protein